MPQVNKSSSDGPSRDKISALALVALGVVFGDIGTSPLYALRECFAETHELARTPENVLGVVSLIIWATLILIVTIKYISVVLRADNRGEGGILALMTLVTHLKGGVNKKYYPMIISLGILGAALLYSDGIITPAISVLSAVEGLNVATNLFKPLVMPLSLIILVALFFLQSRGTARVGMLFGPVILIWFITIGALGFFSILRHPAVLHALNPFHAIRFLIQNGWRDFSVLGSIFLAVTGAEVLYADLGHFGPRPVRLAWFVAVLPGLLLNYIGQGAYLLGSPRTVENLFYLIAPSWLLYPLVALATSATIIASQAVISGAYSLARQSVQLGFWPRIQVRHTSQSHIGQVYVPFVNWCLLAGVSFLILFFKQSGNLASAYGIAVSSTMLLTTILIIIVARRLWSAPLVLLIPAAAIFLFIDASFLAANVIKIATGGWIVIIIAAAIFILMRTWIDGRAIVYEKISSESMRYKSLLKEIEQNRPIRVPGVAVYLAGAPDRVPRTLLRNMKHNKILHEHAIILTVKNEEIPRVEEPERIQVGSLGQGLYNILLRYGFTEHPDVPATLNRIKHLDFDFESAQTSYFLGRETLIVESPEHMSNWRKKIFSFMSHNAEDATHFFRLPPSRVMEIGSQIKL